MATFEQWILAAVPGYPIKAIGRPFENCPLAGIEKFNRYLFGCEYKLGSVGGTKKKWHRACRYQILNKAFFDACRNYWCARRAIVRWRERRMQERGSGTTLAGDPLSGLPSRMLVRLVDGRTKHTFYIRDLLQHMQTRLLHSDYFIPEPLAPTNPLTGMPLSESNQMRIFLLAFSPEVYVPLHKVLLSYWRVGLSIGGLQQCEQVMLHEMAIVNEPGQAGPELLNELGDMYREAGLDAALVPSVAEARAINSINVLLSTHTQAFISYYLMHRSWCEYMSQFARQNLAVHCAAALAAYSEKTQEQRKRYWAERIPPSPLPLAPPEEALAQPPQLEPESYESEDDAALIMTLPEDLELVRRPAAAAAAGPAPEEERPPIPLVSLEEHIGSQRSPPSRAAEEDEMVRHNAAVADLMEEFRAILDGTDGEIRQEEERHSRPPQAGCRDVNWRDVDDDLSDKVSAFADEHLRPLSLGAAAAIARQAQEAQPQAEGEGEPV